MKQIKWVKNTLPKTDDANLPIMNLTEVKKARTFHKTIPGYERTPLAHLTNMAEHLGVKDICVKDESYRFGLNAFKVLGGSFAMAKYIAKQTGRDISELDFEKLTSDKLREEFGQATFFTATDGNHGRGVAWAANRLKQKAVVYMPKGSTQNRLNHILAENATATIEEVNYFNEDVKNTGVELSYAMKHDDNWSTRWGATYQNPKAQNKHTYGDMGWHHIYNNYQLQGAVDYAFSKFTASMSVNFVGDRVSTRAAFNKPQRELKPQCFTDLHFTYAPEKNQKAFLHINNLFDRLDITTNSTANYYSLGRNFMVGYEYSF